MSLLDGLAHRIRVLLRGESYAREVERELRFHLELETLARTSHGRGVRDAEIEACRAVGSVTYYREESRDMTLLHWVDRIRQDTTYAVRGLARSPGFTATVVVTLALGFGVNAAMYSILDRVFRRAPAGVIAPREVRRLYLDYDRPKEPGGRTAFSSFTFPHFRAVAAAVVPLELAAFTQPDSVGVVSGATRIPARESEVTGNYFSVLGVRPQLGRFFVAEENAIEIPTPVAVVSDGFWRRELGGDARVLGRKIAIDHRTITIVGVAPREFVGPDLDVVDVWLPVNMMTSSNGMPGPWYANFGSSVRIITRVRSPAEAARVIAAGTPALHGVHLPHFVYDSTSQLLLGSIVEANGPLKPAQEVLVATRISWIAVIVLVIAAANVTNLLLLRASRRKREIAVRRALGVSQGRLYGQLAVESTLLSLLGGVAALVVAVWVGTALRQLMMPRVHWASSAVDGHTVAFLFGLSVIIGLGAGLAPAVYAAQPNLTDSLKAGARESAYQRSMLRSVLLVVQATLCVVLLVGAGLFLRSLDNVRSIGVGYDVDNVTLVSPVFSTTGPHDAELAGAIPMAAGRVSRVDGVVAVGYALIPPMQGISWASLFLPDRDSLPRLATDVLPSFNVVSPDYFRAAGVAIQSGRAFSAGDAGAVVVSETMARVFWPGESPIGKCLIRERRSNPCSTVVGVAADVHRMDILEQPTMQYYLPATRSEHAPRILVIRARPGRSAAVAHEAERILAQALPGLDGTRTRRMVDVLEPELRPWRLGATLFTAFGILALVVAAIGMYSVVAYGVSQRTNEMGIRVALGARTSDILDLVVGEGIRLLAIGLALGVVTSLALGRFIGSLLFGITPYDASVLIGATTVLCALGILACLIPGWRAARVDPVNALRAD
jgi:putative ABC transport system permease protein